MPQPLKPISVIVFPGGFNWPIWVAQEKGLFDRNGIVVTVTPTPDSKFQLTNLIDGKFDIAMTAIDNVIAYMEGQGAAPTSQTAEIFAFMGADNGFLRLVTIPEVKDYEGLKGRQLSVDAMTTGYAFVLRKLLEKGGLKPSEIEFVSAGGVMQRFQALLEKKHAGTLLISPFEVGAEARGFNRLANADEALGATRALLAPRAVAGRRTARKILVGFIRAYVAALDWLFDPRITGSSRRLPQNLPFHSSAEVVANKWYEIMLHPTKGFTRRAELDVEGVKTVLELRSEYAEPRKPLGEPVKYYDLQYYDQARAR